jgi:hypothetical protein
MAQFGRLTMAVQRRACSVRTSVREEPLLAHGSRTSGAGLAEQPVAGDAGLEMRFLAAIVDGAPHWGAGCRISATSMDDDVQQRRISSRTNVEARAPDCLHPKASTTSQTGSGGRRFGINRLRVLRVGRVKLLPVPWLASRGAYRRQRISACTCELVPEDAATRPP